MAHLATASSKIPQSCHQSEASRFGTIVGPKSKPGLTHTLAIHSAAVDAVNKYWANG